MNLDKLFKAIERNYKVTKEQILSKNRRSNVIFCKTLLIGYLVYEKKIDLYTVAKTFNMTRTALYNSINNYKFQDYDISLFDGLDIEIKELSIEMKYIYYLIEKHKIKGNLKQYLLNYEEVI